MGFDYAKAQKEYRRMKARLTRAQHSNDPRKVLAEVRYFQTAWPADCPYPDDWSRWQRAADDACFALQRAGKPAEWVTL